MAVILLSSEEFIKEISSISDNTAGKYILPSLQEAQEISLKRIIGEALLVKLKSLVQSNAINSPLNKPYKDLIDMCQYYLAYTTIVEVTNKVTLKISNFGVTKSSDENLQVASMDEVAKLQYYYQSKADAYCVDLQNFLCENRANYPELDDTHYNRISANLHSAASCGIFLGGARGKGRTPGKERIINGHYVK